MQQTLSCTFQAGSSNEVLDVLQFTDVYTGEDVREAFNIRSNGKEKPFASMNDNTEKLCIPQWLYSSCIKTNHVLTLRFQQEILAAIDLT